MQPLRKCLFTVLQIAVKICERYRQNAIKAKVYFCFSLLNVFENHISTNLPFLQAGKEAAILSGNNMYSSYPKKGGGNIITFESHRYIAANIPNTMFWMGEPLTTVYEETRRQQTFLIETTKYRDMKLTNDSLVGYCALLLGLTPAEDSFKVDKVEDDEREFIPQVMVWYLCHKVSQFHFIIF